MKTAIIAVLVLAAVGVAVWYAFGGDGDAKGNTLGARTGATITRIGDIQHDPTQYLDKTVTIEGRMTKQCPTSGCWWYVKDETGEIRADSAGAGFALPLRQEGKRVRTTGKVTKSEGGELQISATGAELP